MDATLVRHIESYRQDELSALRRDLLHLRAELLTSARYPHLPAPRQRQALLTGALAGVAGVAAGWPPLACAGISLAVVVLVLRFSRRPACRLSALRARVSALEIPVGGYMEGYRNPDRLSAPWLEEALIHCVTQELMLIQRLSDRQRSALSFPA